MNKRISAAFVVMLFVLGIVAAPVSAHFTLGELTPDYPFRQDDYDQHLDGVIAYVWPGGGPFSMPPGSSPYPGYQSPYPGDNPDGMRSDWYQLDSTYYAPFGAILTSTLKAGTPFNKMKVSGNPTIETAGTWVDGAAMVLEHANKGDLIIALNATGSYGPYYGFHVDIPPEFIMPAGGKKNLVCSWTNNYDLYDMSTEAMESDHAPLWNYVAIYADPEFPCEFTGDGEWYYIRINDVTAPTIAGRYFFKVFALTSAYDRITFAPPVQNWPVLLVKGEVDPGIITGTIRYGGWNPTLYGERAEVPGRVRAVGIADDPYTFKSTGRPVEARAYFNNTAEGHYEIEGVAPGTYDVYASLAGYPEIKIASGVKVLKGQSAHVDGYLTPGVVIHGEVFSKCGTGDVNWRCGRRDDSTDNPFSDWSANQNIKIEIYRSLDDALATAPASSSTKAISWSPATTSLRQFAWPGYGGDAVVGNDPAGVGPDQIWAVYGTDSSFMFQFGDKGWYGAPAEWTGHIPQAYATWTGGIPAGTFHIRAWTLGYVQTLADGVTFAPVTFTVASMEWPGDIFVPFDLMLSSYIVKEFHFHNIPGTLEDNGVDLPDIDYRIANGKKYYLYVDVNDAAGKRHGWAVRGFTPPLLPADYKAVIVRGLLGRSFYQRSYGLLAGTYIVKGYAAGYVDQHPTTVSLGLCGTEVHFSNHLDRGAQFDITVYSVDWEHPSVHKLWTWPGENIYVNVWTDSKVRCPAGGYYDKTPITVLDGPTIGGDVLPDVPVVWGMPVMEQTRDRDYVTVRGYYGAEAYYQSTDRIGSYPLAFETGTYSFQVYTYGYVQKKPFTLYVVKGAKADIPIKVLVGLNVTFDLIFKRERIMDHLQYDSAVRVRLFNDAGVLVGEALTSDYTKYYVNTPNTESEPDDSPYTAQLQAEHEHDLDDEGHDDKFINYVPSSTTRLSGLIAGLPDLYRGGYNPEQGTDLFGKFNNGSPDLFFDMNWAVLPPSAAPPFPAPYGIDAHPNYKGGWYIEVDVVPWYEDIDAVERPPFVARGAGGILPEHITIYYPPPPGLLTGESPKYIPENHFGPYEQRVKVTVPGGHLGGEASVIFEVDLRGLFTGNVYTYTHCDDWRTTSWIIVQAVAADGKIYNWYTFDGMYEAWLTPGVYAINIIEWAPAGQGHKVVSLPSLTVTEGGVPTMNFYLEQSGVPIPEFTTTALVLASALAASLFILRRRRK